MSLESRYLIDTDKPLVLGSSPASGNPYDAWPPPRNFNPPPGSDWFQRELLRIAGAAPNGMPMLRLEWGSIATWTPYTRHLKYLQRVVDRQVGWLQDVRGADGSVVKTMRYPLKADIPQPDATYGLPYPSMSRGEEIGIPRWWVSQYTPPEIIGPWDEARRRVRGAFGHPGQEADMGPMPREGFYFLGWHLVARIVPHVCCERAKAERRTCFHLYREPSELDLEYVRALWARNYAEAHTHDWREAPSDEAMKKNLCRIVDSTKEIGQKEREAMKLRIRDAFNSHRQRFTARKGKSQWIFTSAGGERKIY